MKTQAWGWLAAAVLAAGLNASYHDGGLPWAHEIADQLGHSANAVLALATGHADSFLAEAQVLTANHDSSCPFSNALARVQSRVSARVLARMQRNMAASDANFARFEGMSDREEAQLVRLEAGRARMEAQIARIRIPAVAFNPVAPEICPRMRMNLPRVPVVKVPAVPMIHIETPRIEMPGAGPV